MAPRRAKSYYSAVPHASLRAQWTSFSITAGLRATCSSSHLICADLDLYRTSVFLRSWPPVQRDSQTRGRPARAHCSEVVSRRRRHRRIRGLVAALAIGASEIKTGTRLVATAEAPVHQNVNLQIFENGRTVDADRLPRVSQLGACRSEHHFPS